MASPSSTASERHNAMTARSYYSLTKARSSTLAGRLPDVGAATPAARGLAASSVHLSRPPSAQSLPTALPELTAGVHAPVPLRTTAVGHRLPGLPPAPLLALASSNESSAAATGLRTSQGSLFRPVASAPAPAAAAAAAASACPHTDGGAGLPETAAAASPSLVKPKLCPPTRPARGSPALDTATRTTPFYADGVAVCHLPSCTLRTPLARRRTLPGAPLAPPVAVDPAVALWDSAATEADVLAFFGAPEVAAEWSQPLPAAAGAGAAVAHHKELSWPLTATMHSGSVCDLSLSEDMFSIGTASSSAASDGAAVCAAGSHRTHVIDLEALATFQRDGARRQREVPSVTQFNSTAY